MKKSAVLLTVIGTLILSANFAFADQVSTEESMDSFKEDVKVLTLEDIEEKSGNYELIINQSTQQYKYLYDWGNTLRYLGACKLSADAYTKTSQVSETISTSIYLQQYDESSKIFIIEYVVALIFISETSLSLPILTDCVNSKPCHIWASSNFPLFDI